MRAELEALAQAKGRAAEVREIAGLYPLPAMDTLTLTYEHTGNGKVKAHKLVNRGEEVELVPIATPFGVSARLRHADQADAYGLRCVLQT